MARPLLQVALDQAELPAALKAAEVVAAEVDVIEAGTPLCFSVGVQAVASLRKHFPQHFIVADFKAADGGAGLAEMAFSRGATWLTIISCALTAMKASLPVARKFSGDIQIALYGEWTMKQAEEWKHNGLKQAIYHRAFDAEAAGEDWSERDLERIKGLASMGFEVSVTGGLKHPEDLSRFRGIPVKCFIMGRSLCESEDPAATARGFRAAITRDWS
ncbi:MAG: 3-dehydro-L-gulonate-6-phosphate decarboxylase [Spirochaetia bacterium]|jgi:3-keto-L-gulonate-6-phosphate decarboxylase